MSTETVGDKHQDKEEAGEPSRAQQRKVYVDDPLWEDAKLAAVLAHTSSSALVRKGLRSEVNRILGTGTDRFSPTKRLAKAR